MYLEVLDIIKEELSWTRETSASDILPVLYTSDRIFITGAGRSKLIASMFAMRLMHCGYNVHMVGDVTTPRITKDDVLLVVSSSGNTSQLIDFAVKAKGVGAKTMLLTSNVKSTLKSLCDITIQIGCELKQVNNILPLGGRFELSALVFLDSLIIEIMKDNNLTNEDLQNLHANLE